MFLDPAAGLYREASEVVALCDSSLVRARYHRDRIARTFGTGPVPVYAAADFRKMIEETRPNVVVVCTVDSEHARFIVAALESGCDVVTEKPMTIDATSCARILDAVRTTGRSVRVAFNYRWGPGAAKVREVLAGGVIGRIWHVNLEYLLNTSHGADYFRRWHAHKDRSGGLLVHKSTHHFDLVNWWTDSIPETVHALGDLRYYGRAAAESRGDAALAAYPRYHDSGTAGVDPFHYAFEQGMLRDANEEKALYLEAESESGYVRDRNVFRDDVTIEDTMSVLVRYRGGMQLAYTLVAYSPYEGFRVSFTGERGRVEYEEFHGRHVLGHGEVGLEHMHHGRYRLVVHPHFKEPYEVDVAAGDGGHGGADPALQDNIFSHEPAPDPLAKSAGHEQGAASILVGIAANRSIETGLPVRIGDLVSLRPEARRLSELF
jgi:predicted dehydrogenase